MRQEAATPALRVDRLLAAPMAWIALAFLVVLGGAVQAEVSLGAERLETQLFFRGLLLLFPLFALELALHAALGSRHWGQNLVHCFVPPLRLVCRDHDRGATVWLPWAGWRSLGPALETQVAQAFSLPMALISLLVLPVFTIEHYGAAYVARWPALHFSLDAAQSLVWIAFSFEFAVRVSIASKPFKYCAAHWVDLAIICLPFAAFLRLARLGQLARLGEVAKATRAYRLKGVRSRVYGKSPLKRWFRKWFHVPPELTLHRLQSQLAELEQKQADLREEIAQVAADAQKSNAKAPVAPAPVLTMVQAPRTKIVPRRRAA